MKSCEAQVKEYKDTIKEIEMNEVMYVPIKNDAVDKRLAEFINSSPDRARLVVMFKRENDDGLY